MENRRYESIPDFHLLVHEIKIKIQGCRCRHVVRKCLMNEKIKKQNKKHLHLQTNFIFSLSINIKTSSLY